MPFKTKIVSILIFILFVSSILIGCRDNGKDVESLSKNYQETHDYDSLVALLPHLNYTMTRSGVENLLGTSPLCPVAESCTYFSNKSVIVSCQVNVPVSAQTCQSFSLALVVRYELIGEATALPQDRLSNFHLSPVGE